MQKGNTGMIVIVVAAIALLGIGGFFLLQSNNNKTTETPAATENTQLQETSELVEDENSDMDQSGEVKEFTVKANNFAFDRQEIMVKKGDKVKIIFENTQGTHDWVLDEFKARTQVLQAGATEEVEFVADQAGSFEYYCSVGSHRQMGMVGTLTVQE